jgi:hypothetical protein
MELLRRWCGRRRSSRPCCRVRRRRRRGCTYWRRRRPPTRTSGASIIDRAGGGTYGSQLIARRPDLLHVDHGTQRVRDRGPFRDDQLAWLNQCG